MLLRTRQEHARHTLLAISICFALAWATISTALAEQNLCDVVAAGIAKRYPATGSPTNYDRWPMPLRESPGAMMTAAISPDGRLVATGCGHPNQSGELVLWDAETGRERWVLRYPRGIRSVVFTADGGRLATGSFDGVARLIEVSTGKLLREIAGHSDAINGVALSADDRLLVTGSHDRSVVLWDLADGRKLRTFQGSTADVLTVALSKDARLVASAGRDNIVRLWDLESGEAVHTLEGHEGLIEYIAFSPDGSRLASASGDRTLRVWDAESGKQVAMLGRKTHLVSLAFSPEGNEIYCGGFDGLVAVWGQIAEAAASEFKAQAGAVYSIALSADGSRLATCGFEGSARVWKNDGTLLSKLDRQLTPSGEDRRIIHAAWSPDELTVAAVHTDGTLRLTTAADGREAGVLSFPNDKIMSAVFARDGRSIFVGTKGGGVFRWKLGEEARAAKSIAYDEGAIDGLILSPDGKLLSFFDNDGAIFTHDAVTGRKLARWKADSPARCAAFDDSSSRLATGHDDGRIRWWNAATGKEITQAQPSKPRGGEQPQPVRALVLASGNLLAAAAGGSIELWGVTFAEGEAQSVSRRVLTLPEGEFTHLAVSSGSQQIVTGDTTNKVRLWDLSGGAARTLPRQHPGGVTAVAIAPDSAALLTAGADLNAWLWQPSAAGPQIRPLALLPAHEKGTRYVALAKGNRLLTDGYDNHVRVWNLESGQEEMDLGVPDSASACVLLPGGTRVAVGHWSRRIQLVELATGEPQENIRGLPRGPYAIALSPREDRMAAVFRELGAMVYDLTSDEADPAITLPPDELPFTHVAFTPDGMSFVTCTGDYQRMQLAGKVRLHDAKSGTVIRSFAGHESEVKMATFDADGKRLATASGDKTVRLWDVESGKLLATLPHSIGTFAPLFVPDSELLLTADYHGKVFLWDLARAAIVQEVVCHSDLVSRLALSDDLSVLASGSRDGTAKLWKLTGQGNDLRIIDKAERRVSGK